MDESPLNVQPAAKPTTKPPSATPLTTGEKLKRRSISGLQYPE